MMTFPAQFKDSNRTWTYTDGRVVSLNDLTWEERAEIAQLLIDNYDLVRAAHRRDLIANAPRNGWDDEMLAGILRQFDRSGFDIEATRLMKRLRKLGLPPLLRHDGSTTLADAKTVHYYNPTKAGIACGVKEHPWTEFSEKREEVNCGRCRQLESFPTKTSPVVSRFVEPQDSKQ